MATQVAEKVFTGKPCKRGHISERWVKTRICIACAAEHRQARRKQNPEAHCKYNLNWAKQNRSLITAYHKEWRNKNKEQLSEWRKEYRTKEAVRAARTAEAGQRRAAKRQACPPWVDRKELQKIYKACREQTKLTGILHHVDHIVPLTNPLVCGLHVPWNLQVLNAKENLKKSNDFPVSFGLILE